MPLELQDGMLVYTESVDRKYDESLYFATAVPAGTDIYLPNSETYTDATSILVFFNSVAAEAGRNFTIPGASGNEYITTVDDLPINTVVRFKKM